MIRQKKKLSNNYRTLQPIVGYFNYPKLGSVCTAVFLITPCYSTSHTILILNQCRSSVCEVTSPSSSPTSIQQDMKYVCEYLSVTERFICIVLIQYVITIKHRPDWPILGDYCKVANHRPTVSTTSTQPPLFHFFPSDPSCIKPEFLFTNFILGEVAEVYCSVSLKYL